MTMLEADADVIQLLDTCRLFASLLSAAEMTLLSGLTRDRFWRASQIIASTGLVQPQVGSRMHWPTNEAVLEKYHNDQAMRCAAD